MQFHPRSDNVDPLDNLSQDPMTSNELPPRATWSHPCEFLMAIFSYINGLAYMGRFMIQMFRNGGGMLTNM